MTKPDANGSPLRTNGTRHFLFLEAVAAAALILTMFSLVWMMIASYQPTWLRFASVEAEVITVVALFVAALLLVSLIALLHTRD
jgi:succinate dehydrogenase hydrophobic anchor subunit